MPYFTGLTDVEGDLLQKGLTDYLTSDLISRGDGSVKGGGILRESVTTETRPAVVILPRGPTP